MVRSQDAVIMSNHVALMVGPSLEQAYWRLETVEHTAEILWRLRALGGGVELTPEQAAALRPKADPSR